MVDIPKRSRQEMLAELEELDRDMMGQELVIRSLEHIKSGEGAEANRLLKEACEVMGLDPKAHGLVEDDE